MAAIPFSHLPRLNTNHQPSTDNQYPDFTTRDAAILQPEVSDQDADKPHVQFRSGPHTLIARTIEGTYPNYRQVIPHEFLADATIPKTHRPWRFTEVAEDAPAASIEQAAPAPAPAIAA